MSAFFTEEFPELVKKILVIVITAVPVTFVAPPLMPAQRFESPLGTIYLSHLIIALFLGLFLNKIVQGVISLLVLAGVAYLFFEYGYQIQAVLTRFSK